MSGKPRRYWKPAKMVGWYDPVQLLRTALQVAKSSLFAENADGRLVQPLFDPSPEPPDERFAPGSGEPRKSITIDYIADTGDGFDSTYAVAYWATEPVLTVGEGNGSVPLPRGDLLVLGGDLIYPTPSAEGYEERFVIPYEMASADFEEETALYAIPGNHDWYDNLVAFTRLFINRRKIGKFRLQQTRSYFALKLPHGYWLVAPDVQLGSDIDYKQLEYFQQVIGKLPEDARIILCVAEPHWVTENEELRNGTEWEKRSTLLRELEQALHGTGGRIRAIVAGDLHHYRRHLGRVGESESDVQLITAGGGGAFLHPTHAWRDGSDPTRRLIDARLPPGLPHYRFAKAYPSPEVSRTLTANTLLFPFLNGRFLRASAFVYGLVAIQVVLEARLLCSHDARRCADVAMSVLGSPGVMILATLIVAGFWAFTDTSSKWYRRIAGSLHGLTHTAAAAGLPTLAIKLSNGAVLAIGSYWAPFIVTGLVVALTAVGAVFGAFVMGVYLHVSLNVFGRHRNEAFSALKEERYKSFLRLRIEEDGTTNLYVIGIERPPFDWEPGLHTGKPPDGKRRHPSAKYSRPFLVEKVTLDGPRT